MKRIIVSAGVVALLVGIVLVACPGLRCVTPARSSLPAEMPVDRVRQVAFEIDQATSAGRTALQTREQMLDWLLVAVISTRPASAGEVRDALYDVPTLRRGYLDPLANFEYGPTRSRYVGQGRVIALVPPAPEAQRLDDLARIADEHHKNVGEAPKTIEVFEYELATDGATASITRRAPVAGATVFTERYGHRREAIRSADDLRRFMGAVDDVTVVGFESGSLVLSGRKIQAGGYRGLRVEDVSAVWQAQSRLESVKHEIDAFNARWKLRTYSTEPEKRLLEAEFEREKTALDARLRARRQVAHIGFSLDPAYDYGGLTGALRALEPLFKSVVESGSTGALQARLAEARAALANRDALPLLKLVDRFSSGGVAGSRVAASATRAIHEHAFQSARYDGDLQGTEVGMVLFYTDLLAKLWALDYAKSAPTTADVEDFVPLLRVRVAPIYWKEQEDLPGTRLWFGPQDKGFQLAAKGDAVLFGRNATRVYAASSNPLAPGQESEPNAVSAAFLSWWDRHYEEIARHEPEYQRLNQIMKWSLIVSWLAHKERLAALGFLDDEKVERSHWFPQWVRRHPELKFGAWDRVAFFARGAKGASTESLPLLVSERYVTEGRATTYSGGVSLGSKQLFAERRPLSEATVSRRRRSHLDYQVIPGGTDVLRTLDKTEYTLPAETRDRASVVAKASSSIKLRGRDVELRNVPFETTFVRQAGGLRIDTRSDGVALAALEIKPEGNVLRIGVRSLQMDRATGVVRRLGRAAAVDAGAFLAADDDVESVRAMKDGPGHLVKLKNTSRWFSVVPEGPPSVNIAPGADMRLAGAGGGSDPPRFNVAWVSPGDVPRGPGGGQPVRDPPSVGPPGTPGKGQPPTRGPPVDRVDRPFAQGRDREASRALDELVKAHGAGADLVLRRALLLVVERRLDEAAGLIDRTTGETLRDVLALSTTIDARTALARPGDPVRMALDRVGEYARARERLQAQPVPVEIRPVVLEGGKVLDFNVRLLEVIRGQPVTAPETVSGRVYVQGDSPKLGNLDWNVSVSGALNEVTSQGLGTVVKLPAWAVPIARPAFIEEGPTKIRYELKAIVPDTARVARRSPPSSSGGSPRPPRDCPPGTRGPGCGGAPGAGTRGAAPIAASTTCGSDTERGDCDEDVYLVKANRPATTASPAR